MAREVGQVLGEISEDEHAAGRAMLTAVAVAQDSFRGDGFYKLARNLGLPKADASAAEELAFWMAEERKVYEAWTPNVVALRRRRWGYDACCLASSSLNALRTVATRRGSFTTCRCASS